MRKPKIVLYAGMRVGRLSLVEINKSVPGESEPKWTCSCECGKITKIASGSLRSGAALSCGCFRSEFISFTKTIHGANNTPAHRSWQSMRGRCYNKNNKKYPRYGGRGICVCERWHDFPRFLADMGPRPSEKRSIDRIDNDGNYSCGKCEECLARGWPLNCRWANDEEQSSNRSNNRRFTINNITDTISGWGERTGFGSALIGRRLGLGWTIEEAVSAPIRSVRNNHRKEK